MAGPPANAFGNAALAAQHSSPGLVVGPNPAAGTLTLAAPPDGNDHLAVVGRAVGAGAAGYLEMLVDTIPDPGCVVIGLVVPGCGVNTVPGGGGTGGGGWYGSGDEYWDVAGEEDRGQGVEWGPGYGAGARVGLVLDRRAAAGGGTGGVVRLLVNGAVVRTRALPAAAAAGLAPAIAVCGYGGVSRVTVSCPPLPRGWDASQ